MRVYFCTPSSIAKNQLPPQEELVTKVIQRLDKQAFERAAVRNGNPSDFTSHVGVVRLTGKDVEYSIDALPRQKEVAATSSP